MTGTKYTSLDFGTIVLLSVVVLLDDNQWNRLYFLIGSKTFATLVTHTTTANRIVIICRSRIYYSGIFTTAKRTLHVFPPFLGEPTSPKPQYIDSYYTFFAGIVKIFILFPGCFGAIAMVYA